MSLNSMGLGITFRVKNETAAGLKEIGGGMRGVKTEAQQAAAAAKQAAREAAQSARTQQREQERAARDAANAAKQLAKDQANAQRQAERDAMRESKDYFAQKRAAQLREERLAREAAADTKRSANEQARVQRQAAIDQEKTARQRAAAEKEAAAKIVAAEKEITKAKRASEAAAKKTAADEKRAKAEAEATAKKSASDQAKFFAGMQLKVMWTALADIAGRAKDAIVEATQASVDFQKSVAQVMTIADPAQFDDKKVSNMLKAMAAQYGGSLETQAGALYTAIGSGAETAADANVLLAKANQLAVGGLTTVDTAMQGVMGTLNSYNMAYSRAGEVTDAFFAAVKLGGSDMNVQTLANGLGRAAPAAAAFGVSLNELLGSVARLTAVGIKTDEAITGIKAAMDQFLKPTKDAVEEAKRLGIIFDQSTLKTKGLLGAVQEITSAKGFKEDSLTKLFGGSTVALNAMLALAQNGGADFQKFMNEMANAGGATSDAFAKLAETTAFQQSRFDSLSQTVKVTIGSVVEPLLAKFLAVVNGLMDAFLKLPGPMQKFIVFGTLAVGAALLLATGIVAVAASIMLLDTALAPLLIALAAVVALVPIILAGMAGLALAAAVVKAAWDRDLGGIKTVVMGVYEKVKLAWDAISMLFEKGGFTKSMNAKLKESGGGVEKFAIQVYVVGRRIVNFFTGAWRGVGRAVDEMRPTFDRIRVAFVKVGEALGKLFGGSTADSNRKAFQKTGEAGEKFGHMLGGIIEIGAKVIAFFAEAAQGVAEFLVPMKPMFALVWTIAMQAWDAFVGIGDALVDLAGSFGFATDNGKGFGSVIGSFIVTGLQVAAGVIAFVAGVFRQISFAIRMVALQFKMLGAMAEIISRTIKLSFLGMVYPIALVADKIAAITGKKTNFAGGIMDSMRGALTDDLSIQKDAKASRIRNAPAGRRAIDRHRRAERAVHLPGSSLPVTSGIADASKHPGVTAATTQKDALQEAAGGGGMSQSVDGIRKALEASNAKPPPAINVYFDGEILAGAVSRVSTSEDNRSYKPGPPPR